MAHAVRMPRPGQMTEECVLSMWRVAEGERVSQGDVVFEIETDKSTMEVESFHDGVLLKRVFEAGETVPVNAICAWIGEPGEAVPEAAGEAVPEAVPEAAVEAAPATEATPSAAAVTHRTPIEAGMTLAVSPPRPPEASATRPISPRARARAIAAGLEIRSITATGPGGRIVERDVEAAIAARDIAPASRPAAAGVVSAVASAAMPAWDGHGQEPPRPLSRMRRLIAERLTLAATTIPTFTATVAVDVTRALALREEFRAEDVPVTVTDLVLAATAQTLSEFPDVNSRTDGQLIWPRRRVHLGMAVALPAGLVVAVVRDADRLGLLELHDEAARLVAEARAGRLSPDAMTGGTFTVSNLGMFGIEEFAAIINPGESGILAVGAAIPAPVAVSEGIAVRTLMRLTLTADHRLVDGELAARFLGALRRRLEDPASLRRELQSR